MQKKIENANPKLTNKDVAGLMGYWNDLLKKSEISFDEYDLAKEGIADIIADESTTNEEICCLKEIASLYKQTDCGIAEKSKFLPYVICIAVTYGFIDLFTDYLEETRWLRIVFNLAFWGVVTIYAYCSARKSLLEKYKEILIK